MTAPDAMPERVWLVYTDEVYVAYHNDDQPWPCYVPESRALAAEARLAKVESQLKQAERERDDWSRRAFEGQAKRDQLEADLATAERERDMAVTDRVGAGLLWEGEVQGLRADLAALVPFARKGLESEVNWYGNHLAARAVLARWEGK